MGIRNREAYFNLQASDYDSDSSDDEDIIKYLQFSNRMESVEQEIMQLYKEKFNIDPRTEMGYSRYTEAEQIERYAQNITFWQKLLLEYDDEKDFESCASNPRYMYIKMKESEVRVNVFRKFDRDVLERIFSRVLELVNGD